MRTLIPNSTQIPDVILDHWMARLSGAEFKIVLYIARRTYGFGKESDTISINQISRGIRRRDGVQLDYGTGLSRSSIKSSCATLVERGILIKTQATVEGSSEPDENTYRLNLYAAVEDEETGGGEAGNGTDNQVGQNITHVGQKSAYLPRDPKAAKKVGQKSAHVGQKETQVGQGSPYGGPETNPQVGQILAPQETDQETGEQETATERPVQPSDVVVASSPPAVLKGEAESLLISAGFSAAVAGSLAHHGPEAVRRQIEALPRRKVGKNRLGLLRKAIEENWDLPATPQQEQVKAEAVERKASQELQEARDRAQAQQARETLARLRSAAPEAFSAFLSFVEDRKLKALTGSIAKSSSSFRQALEKAYDGEEKQLELLPEFLASHPVGRGVQLNSHFAG